MIILTLLHCHLMYFIGLDEIFLFKLLSNSFFVLLSYTSFSTGLGVLIKSASNGVCSSITCTRKSRQLHDINNKLMWTGKIQAGQPLILNRDHTLFKDIIWRQYPCCGWSLCYLAILPSHTMIPDAISTGFIIHPRCCIGMILAYRYSCMVYMQGFGWKENNRKDKSTSRCYTDCSVHLVWSRREWGN